MQIQRESTGSIILHWKSNQIKNTLIPILSKSTQKNIGKLVQNSIILRQQELDILKNTVKSIEDKIDNTNLKK